ncbi:MAG TPA: hypothetical protein VFG14_11135, partial [Chthoniobacteraceae bacterium]|nr:hypothetical protein [Chthoniobacteraceae bacterium]
MTIAHADPPLFVIRRGHDEFGPFCEDTVREALNTGNVVPDDWIRLADGRDCWTSVEELLSRPPIPPGPVTKACQAVS